MFSLTSLTDPSQNYFSTNPKGPRKKKEWSIQPTGSGEPPHSLQAAPWQRQLIQGAIHTGHEGFLPPMPSLPVWHFTDAGCRTCDVGYISPVVLPLPDFLIQGTIGYLGFLQMSESSFPHSQFQSVSFMVRQTWPTNQTAWPLQRKEASTPQNGRLLLPLGTPRKKAGYWDWVSFQTARSPVACNRHYQGEHCISRRIHNGSPVFYFLWLILGCSIKNSVQVWSKCRSPSIYFVPV